MDWATPLLQLLALVNPLAALPFYLQLLRHAPARARAAAARTSAMVTAAVLVGSALGGGRVLSWLGVSLPSLQVSGGLMLLVQALATLRGAGSGAGPALEPPPAGESWRRGVVMPLTIPLLVGPATVGLVVTRVGSAAQPAVLAVWAGLGLATAACVYVVFRAATGLAMLLGDAGVRLLAQLGALVLAALAVASMAAGLGALFPVLGTASG